eukprot:403352695
MSGFGQGLEFNSAVKFNVNDRDFDNNVNGDQQPYYAFSTSTRQKEINFDKNSAFDQSNYQSNQSQKDYNTAQEDISFMLNQQQIDALYDLIAEPDEEEIDYKVNNEHFKVALWLIHKLFTQRGLSLRQIQMRNQNGMFHKLNKFIQTENPELMLLALRVLLAFLQKFDSQDIPIKEMKDIGLIETIHESLDHDNELLGELTRLALSILTQISYSFPSEVAKFNIKKIITLCDSTCGDLRTQEFAIKLICNLLTNEVSRDEIIKNDGLFGIFHCLLNNNKAALKYSLASVLNLTFLTNAKSQDIIQQIALNGGIAHLIGALQKSQAIVYYQSMIYAVKSLSNLAMSSPNINIVIGEFGAFDVIIQILKEQSQIQIDNDDHKQNLSQLMTICLISIQSIASHNLNKIQLIDKTTFLLMAHQILVVPSTDPNVSKILIQILGQITTESYLFSKKIQASNSGSLVQEVYKLMMRSSDEGLIRKCMRLYIQMANSGSSLSGVITSNELQQFKEEKRSLLSLRGEKLLSKLETAYLKPNQTKKQLITQEEALDWDLINKIRKATKGCLTILKDKINLQFEKKKEFDMSFGLGKDPDDELDLQSDHDLERVDISNNKIGITDKSRDKFQQYKDALNKEQELFQKKREDKLAYLKNEESSTQRKSQTPLRSNVDLKKTNIQGSQNYGGLPNVSQNLNVKTQRQDLNKSTIDQSNLNQTDALIRPINQRNLGKVINNTQRHQTPGPTIHPSQKLTNKANISDNANKLNSTIERFNMLEPLPYQPQIRNENILTQYHPLMIDPNRATVESFNSFQNHNLSSSIVVQSTLQNQIGKPLIKGGPLSIHSFNQGGNNSQDSRMNSRQSQGMPLNRQVSTIEPTNITEELMQPTFDSYMQGDLQYQMQNQRIDPFPGRQFPNQNINNEAQNSQGSRSFASSFLPMKRREEIDIDEQIKQFKMGGSQPNRTQNNWENSPPIQSQQYGVDQQQMNSSMYGGGSTLNQQPQMNQTQSSQNAVRNNIPKSNEQMVLENQAKIQMLDRKSSLPSNRQNILNKSQQSLVPYQQNALMNRTGYNPSQQDNQVNLPPLPDIDINKYAGQELPIIERFLDVSLIDKDQLESKHARHHLGLGMPEARAIFKRNGVQTMREIIEWYKNSCQQNGQGETQIEVQRSICSSQLTCKIISLILLTGHALGYQMIQQ